MIRKLKRSREFDISLQIKSDDFINPPHLSQRHWLLNKLLSECVGDLTALDLIAKRFVPGRQGVNHPSDRTQGDLAEEHIMEDWQIPLMQTMAEAVTETHGDILEIGFGRGISATYIQTCGVRSHTLVECNDAIVQRFQDWRKYYPDRDIRLIHGKWQDTVDQFGAYDGIFFHTYPLNEHEYLEHAVNSGTFAAHFFPTAAAHLRAGGLFTYLTHEIDSLSREHQRLLFRYFKTFTLQVVPLSLPEDNIDAWWADSMVVIKAVK